MQEYFEYFIQNCSHLTKGSERERERERERARARERDRSAHLMGHFEGTDQGTDLSKDGDIMHHVTKVTMKVTNVILLIV